MAVSDVITFGPYRLIPEERLLLRDGEAVDVGSRALDILIALVEAAGEVVSQRDLIARAWPSVVVGDGSLRVTIASLRKALGGDADGARYIANVTGRGYCFVAHVDRSAAQQQPMAPLPVLSGALYVPKHKLPPRPARMVGRQDAIEALSVLLAARRFVSVVGPGGMGKTTVAVSVAHAMLAEFGNAVHFVDLSAVTDSAVVSSAVATAVGSSVQAHDPLPSLMAFLAGRRILLVLDNCEHVIDAATSLTERLYNDAPEVHILTTSREALRAEGEHVHLLTPLDYPTVRDDLTAAEALATPAVQLFMERAFASGYIVPLKDADAPTVAAICSRLDGIALAIELAGSRVGAYGLQGTADLLSNRFKLLWQGRRSAPPRHKTLAAMLDWSFNLLSDWDRRVLSRLSIFVGVFTLEAAQAVAADDETDAIEVAEAISSLIDKSLVWVAQIDGIAHHRLLDTTLAFAAEKLAQTDETNAVARRHALYYANRLSSGAGEGVTITIEDVAFAAPYLGNIRAALEWSFSDAGDVAIGVPLAAAAAPLFFDLALLVECVHWCEQGLAALPEGDENNATRLVLQANLAASAMFSRGNGSEVRAAIDDGLRLAEALGDLPHQLHLLAGLNIFLTRLGDFQGAMAAARSSVAIAEKIASPAAIATGEWMLGVACHLSGDQASAQRHCERGLTEAAASDAAQVEFFGYDHRIRGLVALARALWLTGFPDRAAKTARRAIDEAVKRDQPVNLCIAMIYTATVFLWRGDFDEADHLIRRLVAHATRHSLGPYHAVGLALTGELAIARGDPSAGVSVLRRALGVLHAERHNILTPAFHRALADGLMQSGDIDEALAVLNATTVWNETQIESSSVPELLRIRGEILLKTTPADHRAAEQAFQLSMQRAKAQSALSLELRAAISLSRLWCSQDKAAQAAELLEAVYRRFKEGHQTADLRRASQMLADLGRASVPFTRRADRP